jgi:hypothetical protein
VGLGIVFRVNVDDQCQGVQLGYGRIGVMVDKVFGSGCKLSYESGNNKVLTVESCILWNLNEVKLTSYELHTIGNSSKDRRRAMEENCDMRSNGMIERCNSTS